MTVTSETTMPDPGSAASERCASCGSPLADDQEWCLECGAARTLIHAAPDWRIGIAIVATVVMLALIGLAIVLINLSTSAGETTQAAASAPTVAATSTPAAPSAVPAAAAAVPATFAGWPVGLSGWTVVLASSRTESVADSSAARFAAGGVPVGVLDSSQHPSMPAGLWFVFSGRYPDGARARAAAATLRRAGQPTAVAIQVARPGGL
ncbi:MAG TPA: SPOR domain-containing protein [Solirubrobacteraceae bacterium]|nr:SPOR domain-containing protein [Solirubrobacteraceae bacterium]